VLAFRRHLFSIWSKLFGKSNVLRQSTNDRCRTHGIVSRDPNVESTLSARVLSMLIPLFNPDISDVSIEEAVHALTAYCHRSLERAEIVFASRQYALADYVRYAPSFFWITAIGDLITQFIFNFVQRIRHPIPVIRLLGLKIALAFLKGSTDQRRAITSINGFRADIEKAAQLGAGDGDAGTACSLEIVSTATEVLDRWKSTTTGRRRG
jgi:hypothetical protein